MTKGKKKKAKWEKIRAAKQLEKEKAAAAPRVIYQKREEEFREFRSRPSRHVMTEGMLRTQNLPSHSITEFAKPKEIVELDPTMIEREEQAQAIANKRKKQIAPICNKGAYQYIGDAPPEVIRTLGRKI